MAITPVQGNKANSSGTVTSLTITLPTGVTQGNLLVIGTGTGNNATTISPPDSSWTLAPFNQPAGTSATIEAGIWYMVVDAAHAHQTSWTWTVSVSHSIYLTLREFHATNGWPANPVDQVAIGDTIGTPVQSTTVVSGTTPTTTQAEELWVAALAYKGSAQTETSITSGWTRDLEATLAGNNTMTMLYQIVAATGAAACQYTIGSAQYWAGCVVTFKDNLSAPPPPTPVLSTNPSTLNFSATVGGGNPANQNDTLSEIAGTATAWTSSITYLSGSGWLSILPTSGSLGANGTATISYRVVTGALTAGTYRATLTYTATTGGATATVSVVFVVLRNPSVNQYTITLAGQDITTHVDQMSVAIADTLGQGSGAGSSGSTQGRAATIKFNTDLGPMNKAIGAGQTVPIDTAMQGDGSSGYISVPTAGLPSGAAPWSMECWFQISSSLTGFQMPMSLGTRVAGEEVNVYFAGDGSLQLELFGVIGIAGPIPTLNTPHYLAVTYNGSALTFYVDAVSQGTVVVTANITYGAAAIGAQASPNNLFFPGIIDESAGYNYALPAYRVAAHMAAGIKPSSPGYAATVLSDNPIWYYRLSELSGTTAKDSSTHHRDGSIVGAVALGLPSLVVNQPVLVRQGEIIITDNTGTIIFGGFATKYTDTTTAVLGHTKQPFTTVEGIDYSTSLQRTLINESFSGATDVYIINFLLQKYAPWINLQYLPTTPAYTFAAKNFRNVTLEQAIQTIAGITGFLVFVDYLRNVHYVSPTSASSAPFNVSDAPDFITTFPASVSEFMVDDNSAINRVFFYGGSKLSNNIWQDVSGQANGANLIFLLAYFPTPTTDGSYHLTVNGVAQALGTANGQGAANTLISAGGTAQALIDPGSKTVTFDTGLAPAAASSVLVQYRYSFPLSLIITDEVSHKFFGPPYLDGSVDDNTIFDVQTAIQRCKVLLAQQSFGLISLKVDLWNHPGVQAGMIINVVNGVRGINSSYLVQEVSIDPIGGGNFIYHLGLGAWNWNLIDFLLKVPTLATFMDDQSETQETVTIMQLVNTITVNDAWTKVTRSGPYYARSAPVGDGHDAYPGLSTISS